MVENVWVVIWPTPGSGSVFVKALSVNFLISECWSKEKNAIQNLLSLLLLSQAGRHTLCQ